MANLCSKLKEITKDKIRILENILWLNTPIDASLINLGIITAPNICDELAIDLNESIEIYEINYIKYDDEATPDNYDDGVDYDNSPIETLIFQS